MVCECSSTDNSPVRSLAVVKKGGERKLALTYHAPAFKPATIELRDLRDLGSPVRGPSLLFLGKNRGVRKAGKVSLTSLQASVVESMWYLCGIYVRCLC